MVVLPVDYIRDCYILNFIIVFQFYDIKKESKNEDLHNKKNKTNVTLRKAFQIKLIKCYKLAINATKVFFINKVNYNNILIYNILMFYTT